MTGRKHSGSKAAATPTEGGALKGGCLEWEARQRALDDASLSRDPARLDSDALLRALALIGGLLDDVVKSTFGPVSSQPATEVIERVRKYILELAARIEMDGLKGSSATSAAASNQWTPDAERISLAREALYQALLVADLTIGEIDRARNEERPLHIALLVRARDLTDAADLLLTEPEELDEDAVQVATHALYGPGYRPRAGEGAAS